ncbi:MAG: hypothetical protein NVSMB31_09780 [Vulcanimicrobiaceae bacterium]
MQWVLDTRDLRAVAQTRRAIAGEITPYVCDIHEGYAVEVIAGEILAAEVSNGARTVTVQLECSALHVTLEIWDDAPAFELGSDPLRDALIANLATTVQVEESAGGHHLTIRLPINRADDDFSRTTRIWQLASALVTERATQMSERLKSRFVEAGAEALFEQTLHQPGTDAVEQPS